MKRMLVVLAVAMLARPLAVAAQTGSLTPAEAVRSALTRHPSVAAARAAVERAAATVREAEAARWPVLSVETHATRFAQPMIVAPLHGFDPTSPPVFDRLLVQSSAVASYALFDAARGPRTDRARAHDSVARIADEGTRQALIAETVIAFLEAIAARDRVMAHEARVAALAQERDRASRLFEAGRAARVVQLRAEAAWAAARADAVAAGGEAVVAARSLARLTGEDPEALEARELTRVRRAQSMPEPDPGEAHELAREGNPELVAQRSRVVAAQAAREEAAAQRLPRLHLTSRFVEYAAAGGLESGEWQGGLQLSYPLFTGGARDAAIDGARAELAGMRAALAGAELDVATAIDAILARLHAAQERVASLDAAVTRSVEVVRIERLALDAGAGVQTDYLTAEADLLAVRSALTDARRALLTAHVELARVTGQLSESWLVTHLELES